MTVALFRALVVLFRLPPRRLCLAAGAALGAFFSLVDSRHRHIARANLERAFGASLPPGRIRRLVRASFRHFGRMLADDLKWITLGGSRRRKLLRVEGEENLRRALEAGRGALLFSAHLGNWEVAAAAVSRFGELCVVARPLDNRAFERELARFRQSLGARVISKFQAAGPVLRALRSNALVAILIDQNVLRSQAVFVDFFGLPAATTPSLAAFHLRTGAPILPVFCLLRPDLAYRVKIGPPLDYAPTGEHEKDVLQITALCTKMIEAEIRENPEQWLWFHDRWRSRPEGEPAVPPPGARHAS